MRGNRFDGDQLVVQQKLATKVFEASHIAPAREVVVCEEVRVSLSNELQARVELPLVLKHLPEVRCKGLWLFDNSSGHGKAAEGASHAGACNKGPDWTGKVARMREGYYVSAEGQSWTAPPQPDST